MHLKHLSNSSYKIKKTASVIVKRFFSLAYNQLTITALKFIKYTRKD